MGIIPDAIVKMLTAADTEDAVFPASELYEEGWMLRLILFSAAQGINCLPFTFAKTSKWYSEAELASPFLRQYGGDDLAETYTEADGVVGHIKFRLGTKGGLELRKDAEQFIVIEAKMSSLFSQGTTNAPDYDQAARTVACMATIIEQSHIPLSNFPAKSLGFYLIAPDKQMRRGFFEKQMTPESIKEKVLNRIKRYEEKGRTEDVKRLNSWYEEMCEPLTRQIDLGCCSWEEAIKRITQTNSEAGKQIHTFYNRCLTECGLDDALPSQS